MDTTRTGAFIRQLRKERNMTQKDLADRLHVTDRAVSKWERGLCAPDIALLEPLSQALGVTVTELLAGERAAEQAPCCEQETAVQAALDYSVRELETKTKRLKQRLFLSALGCVALGFVMLWAILWTKGIFAVEMRSASPDGEVELTVYSCDMTDRFAGEPRVTVSAALPGDGSNTTVYGGIFEGLWWAPDSSGYVLSLDTMEGRRLVLETGSSSINLSALLYLAEGEETALAGAENAEFRFLCWSGDSSAMLFHCTYTDAGGQAREGCVWYNAAAGTLSRPVTPDDVL